VLFLSLGLCYSYYTPLWNPPDEERHFAYCEYIAQNHKLPYLKADEDSFHIAQAIHPPLYYLIGALFCQGDQELLLKKIIVNDGPGFDTLGHPKEENVFPYAGKARSAHLLRLFSLIFSAVNVYFIYLLVTNIFPGEIILASTTALLAAMNPQFLHISASISNENLSTVLSTLYLIALLCYLKNSVKITHHITTGFLLGCCLLSKFSTIIFLPVTVCVIAWVSRRDRTNLIISLFVILGLGALVGGGGIFETGCFSMTQCSRRQ